MALLEAMSNGIACVVTNIGPVHSVLTHQKDGLVVKAGDAKALANAMSKLVQNREWAMHLGKSGKKTINETFGLSQMVVAYRNLFNSI